MQIVPVLSAKSCGTVEVLFHSFLVSVQLYDEELVPLSLA